MTFGNKKIRIDQTKKTTEDEKYGSSWENLTIQLGLKVCFVNPICLF